MSNNNKSMQSTVETVDLDLNEIFDGAVTAEGVTVPEENSDKPKNNIFSKISPDADMSFADPTGETTDLAEEVEKTDEVKSEETDAKLDKEEVEDILDTFAEEDTEEASGEIEEKINKGSNASQIFKTLIEKDKLVGFDDDRSLDEYSVKDWEELIEANLEEKARQIRNETPKQFFESLPEELQIAARYVAEGGQDMKGLFQTLAQTEETRSLNVKSERDQEKIILDYLTATGYGTTEEISEEIEMWKDLGKLEQQASKFKPKLDKMQEKVVAQKLEQQQLKRKQQEQASQTYMQNVYDTLKEGKVNDVKMGRKTQAMLYNGLVEPNYPSVSGKNTNLLGHLLEKYQFVEPNYPLIAEALWLLADPKGYKSKIMDKGAHTAVEKTVRKLKTEQANSGGSSLGVQQRDEEKTSSKRKISRPNNIFKRT
tara:strand:- start:2403 stop:3683 length:1281 start_codon:yes stop_codon:yes gene_type:complete